MHVRQRCFSLQVRYGTIRNIHPKTEATVSDYLTHLAQRIFARDHVDKLLRLGLVEDLGFPELDKLYSLLP